MPSPALGAVSGGIRYQVRFFWRQALAMLAPQPHVSKVVLEHHGVDAVDDVVVFYAPPGIRDRGLPVQVDFHQLKFHVARSGSVDHESLIDPEWTGTKLAMLSRFANAWSEIATDYPRSRLSLVTNWPWNPASPLAELIRDGGRLDDKFFSLGPRSNVGKIRARFQEASGLPAKDFESFAKTLRFSTSAVSQEDAEVWLSDRCQLAGLVPPSHGLDHSAYDDLGARLIESGRTEHTPESLRALVESAGLVADKSPPFRSTFAVRSFTRFAHVPETDGACVLDLTELFHGRKPTSTEAWGEIPSRFDTALTTARALAQPVHVALDAHLSIAWFTGLMLDPRSGIRPLLRQVVKGRGVELWDISEGHRPEAAPDWNIVTTSDRGGTELAVVISVTHDALADSRRHIEQSLPNVGDIVHAALPELGPQSVKDGPHARWLADGLVRILSAKVAAKGSHHLHIFPACPASLAFLLGQEARVLGPSTVYEYDFGEAGRTYRPGMTTAPESPR